MTDLDATAQPERSVKPRKPGTNAVRPIIAVSMVRGQWVDEDGQTGDLNELSAGLRQRPPSILACDHAAELLAYLNERHSFDPAWQFKVTPLEREQYQPHKRPGTSMVLTATLVNYLGWRRSPGSSRNTPNLYHLCIDPVTFSNYVLRRITGATHATCDEEYETVLDLLAWAQPIRDFCVKQQIDLKATQGSTARQFLRDERFYPEARRKVPRSTNDRVRADLPGNEYTLHVPAESDNLHPSCLYIDQSRAHHTHAAKITFPHADGIFAYGNFHDELTPWRTDPKRIMDFISNFHGMILGELEWTGRPYQWRPPYLDTNGPKIWYSTDTDILADLHVRCTAIYAAWGSSEVDHGLNAYAEWAIQELGDNPPAWLKTLLLSTYGTLATRARTQTFGYSKSENGEPTVIRAGSREFTANMHHTKRESEPSTNNVLHRGLIEAATRTESLMLANYLGLDGWQTLGIYADALIVKDRAGRQPKLWTPWRVKQQLHNVQFLSTNAFVSDEVSKVPGGLDRRLQDMHRRAEFDADKRRKGPVSRLMWGTRHA